MVGFASSIIENIRRNITTDRRDDYLINITEDRLSENIKSHRLASNNRIVFSAKGRDIKWWWQNSTPDVFNQIGKKKIEKEEKTWKIARKEW